MIERNINQFICAESHNDDVSESDYHGTKYDDYNFVTEENIGDDVSSEITIGSLFGDSDTSENSVKNTDSLRRDELIRHNMSEYHNLNTIINQHINCPRETFILRNFNIRVLPDIFNSTEFACVKKIVLKNCSLVSLKNLPPNVEIIEAGNNKITELLSQEIPNSVNTINMCNNEIRVLDLSESPNIKILNVSFNPLSNIVIFPPNVEEIIASSTNIKSLMYFHNLNKLRILKLNNNKSHNSSIEDLPDSITELYISQTQTGGIKKLPKSLEKLIAHNANITEFRMDKFPPNLKELDVYNNHLTELPELPDNMDEIDVSNNNLTTINKIPNVTGKFDTEGNKRLFFTLEQKRKMADMTLHKRDSNLNDLFSNMTTHPIHHNLFHNYRNRKNEQQNKSSNQLLKILRGDNFMPNKRLTHRIKHYHVYTI